MIIWCLAVADAWAKWSGSNHTVLWAIREGGDLLPRLSRLLHQASFLTCTVRGGTALDWRAASGWLVRAFTTYETGRNRGDDDADMDIPDEDDTDPAGYDGAHNVDCTVDRWANKCNGGCERCTAARVPRRKRGSALPDHRRHVERPGAGGR